MGPEGLQPPPPGLKGRYAAFTPRPRYESGPRYLFESSLHFITPLTNRDGRIRTGVLLLPRQADCQAFLHPAASSLLALDGESRGGRI